MQENICFLLIPILHRPKFEALISLLSSFSVTGFCRIAEFLWLCHFHRNEILWSGIHDSICLYVLVYAYTSAHMYVYMPFCSQSLQWNTHNIYLKKISKCLFSVRMQCIHSCLCVCKSLHTCVWWPGVNIRCFFLVFSILWDKVFSLEPKTHYRPDFRASELLGSACLLFDS